MSVFTEILSVQADFSPAVKALTKFEADYKQFLQRLNKEAIAPTVKTDSISILADQAKRLTSELRLAAQAAKEVGAQQTGASQAIKASTAGAEQFGKAQKGASSSTLGMQKSFSQIAGEFPALVKNAIVWQGAWLASSALIAAAVAPIVATIQTFRTGFAFLSEVQNRSVQIREILLQNLKFTRTPGRISRSRLMQRTS